MAWSFLVLAVLAQGMPAQAESGKAGLLEGVPVDQPLYAAILPRRSSPVGSFTNAPVLGQFDFLSRSGPLAKPHADLQNACAKCHVPGTASKVSNELCTASGCHAADIGRNQKNKTGLHGSQIVLSRSCGDCHTDHQGAGFDMINDKNPKAKIEGKTVPASAWGMAMQTATGSRKTWDHDLTGYKLLGGHKIDCDECHKPAETRPNSNTRTFLGTDQACLTCHDNYHEFPKGDSYRNCLLCHTFDSWTGRFSSGFDHSKTSFPLNGAHAKELCTACHTKGKPFKPVPHETCETCHAGDGRRAHASAFQTRTCTYCHTEVRWSRLKVATRDHSRIATYNANGAHMSLGCQVCHKNLKASPSKGADNDCLACHNNIHGDAWIKGAMDAPGGDPKIGGGGQVCTKCHSQFRWSPTTVKNKDHKSWSRFELTNKHLALQCFRCHRDLKEIPKSMACASCHADPHKGTRGNNCAQCHSTKGWAMTDFDHDQTAFPLTGNHLKVGCEQCHTKPGVFKHDTACSSCHGSPHLGKLPDTCDQCHTTAGWEQEIFDHNKDSRFRLRGKHEQVACYKCHLDLGFRGTPMACRECHRDYHKGAWGPTDCDQCHNERRWQVERNVLIFQTLHNYGEVVLSGAHERLACETCHAPQPRWLMTGFGGNCNTCHVDVHLGGRGQECHDCHDQQAWLPSRFNHIQTGFPLYGIHRVVACIECHKGNVYTGLPDDCVFCHSDDVQKSGHKFTFGPDCSRCHIPTRWGSHL